MNQKQNQRNELFLAACAGGISDVINFMLNTGGIDLNYLDHSNRSALWLAIHGHHLDVVKQLLHLGGLHLMTINAAIEEAHKQGLNDIVQELLEYPNAVSRSPQNQKADLLRLCDGLHGYDFDVLTAAIKIGNFSLAEKIVDVAEIYIDPAADFTPLVSAIERGNVDLALKLIDKKELDINACGQLEVPPLLAAVKYPVIIKALLARKDINVRRKDRKSNTALHKAVLENALETVKLLVQFDGFKVDAVNKDASCFLNKNSLDDLAANQGTTLLWPLFGRCISKGDYEKAGLSALQMAVALKHSDIAIYLINEAKANAEALLPNGVPLLFLAIVNSLTDVVETLLQHLSAEKLNVFYYDSGRLKKATSALQLAFRMRKKEIFYMLLKSPIDINLCIPSEDGNTDVVFGLIIGEVFNAYKQRSCSAEYVTALLSRQNLNLDICCAELSAYQTVRKILQEDANGFLSVEQGYESHC